ncbi:MAG TPA: zf-HC2 domain-containing protein [Ktedonobacterales bacterium]
MPETGTPYARYSRVTTRRGSLRPLNCPLEPELMVAEFSGELPPDVAQAVREHIAICETCGARAVALRTPYNLLTSLGNEPVPYVPDLREQVRRKASAQERWLRPLRMLGSFGRFSILSVALGVALVGLLIFLLRGALGSIGAFTTTRTTNSLAHPPAAAPAGVALLETNKVVNVGSGFGQTWQVAETLVVDQHSGQVVRSLPTGSGGLTTGSSSSLPVAIATDGQTIYELTSMQNGGRQALVAINASNGATRFILPLTLPRGAALPVGAQAQSLAISPDHQKVYVGIGGAQGKLLSVRALVVSVASGAVTASFDPALVTSAPLPPPTSSLPASAFPSQTPVADLSHMRFSEAAQGRLVISPDGAWLFDALYASDAKGVEYLVIRRIDTTAGQTASALGLPGPFHSEALSVSPTVNSWQLYLVSASPDASAYIVDISQPQLTLLGDIALGGPTTTNGAGLTDALSISPTTDGQRLYVAEDATSTDNVVVAHSRWLLDTQGMGVLASDSEGTSVGAILANTSTSPSAKVFALVNGDVQIAPPDFSASWTPWLHAKDGTPVLQLIASEP